jgi:hypothetical protein
MGALRGAGGPSALDAVPAASFLVLSVDIADVVRSPLGELFAKHEGTLSGVQATCGFHPLERVRTVVVAVPEDGEGPPVRALGTADDPKGTSGDFGVAVDGDLGLHFADCAAKVIAERGGSPRVGADGAYTVVEDDAHPRLPALAFRAHGPALVAQRHWLSTMMRAYAGRAPAIATSQHASLRAAMGRRTVVATAILPKSLRERLKAEMAQEAGPAAAVMAGVLGVSSAALAIQVGPSTEIALELRCESAEGCAEVKKLLETKRFSWSRDLRLRLAGIGPLLDAFSAETHGTTLTATTRARTEDLAGALDRLLQTREIPKPSKGGAHAAPPP